MKNATFKEYVGLALLELYKADKYLYNVAARLKIIEGEIVQGMEKCTGYTDGVTIFLAPPWMDASQEKRLNTLTHEVLHVVSKHIQRIRPLTDYNHMRMNVAADLSIMGQQMELGQKTNIESLVPDSQKYLNMDMFEIYDLLTPDDEQYDQGHPVFGMSGAGDGDEEEGEGDSNSPHGPSLPSPTAEEEFIVDQAIQQAAVQAEAEGYSTAASRAATRHINEMRAKPIRWDYHLNQIASRLKSDLPTWSRPKRRMMSQVYLPDTTKKLQFEATMAMDVSGSVGEAALNQMSAIAQNILTKYVNNLHLITFDDKIVDEWDLKRKDKIVDLELNGCGGTYVQIVIDHLKKEKRTPKLLIIATDGYIPATEDPGYKVVWIITDNPRFTANYGTVIHVNTQDFL